MRIMQCLTALLALGACGVLSAQEPSPEAQHAAERLAATTCSTCHGTGGQNISAIFPNLAAQTGPYLEAQLKAFRDQSRADPDAQAYMWGMASQLNDEAIRAISEHYAHEAPPRGEAGSPALIQRGKVIFQQGIPERGIPACSTCHGDHAQGNGPFPRLAGQHSAYLIKQMLVIQSVLRLAPVMHGVIKELKRDQMQAVAEYLASVGPPAH